MITLSRYNSQSFTQAEEEAVNALHDNLTEFFKVMGFEDETIDHATEDLYNFLDPNMAKYIKFNNSVKKRLTK